MPKGKVKIFTIEILYKDNMDFLVAKVLVSQVIAIDAFEPIEVECLEQAKKAVDLCVHVICCRERFGSLELANQELLAYARQGAKQIQMKG